MKFIQAQHAYRDGSNKPHWLVVHDMEYPERPTGAEWCADFFAGRNGMTAPKASAHYCVDNDSIVQCVRDEDGAWHVPGSAAGKEINRASIGIEHAGYAKQTAAEWQDDYSRAMLEMSAGLVASLCRKHAIPAVRLTPDEIKAGKRGIAGHVDFTAATGKGSHWDPGPGFPWDWYMDRVAAHLAALEPEPASVPPASASGSPATDFDRFVEVTLDGVVWQVSPIYVAPVSIGKAEEIAAAAGCELPSPALVDAIWRAADLKVDAILMVRQHDGTPKTMDSEATHAAQTLRLEAILAGRSLGRDFRLLAGAFKDVVISDGKLGIYGWHRSNGTVIQPFFAGHAHAWRDFSQGLRLVRRRR